ncbi:2-C-methyl-D-erythritol 4-phosphate cytidylyltransferase [Aeromicrobium sp. CTD01-1L150]|uniref:IspD/TarI family cytidylyltransferase n=1 Tax=Aeromicrobium sp. CTD01-1L150 TaxID=3341830 RepID=UPI0035C15AFE
MVGEKRTWAVVLAGGVGLRVGADRPKQLLDLAGRTVLERSLAAFVDHALVDDVVLVVPATHRAAVAGVAGDHVLVIEGGAERSDSTRAAVRALREAGAGDGDRVLVHDAARPLVSGRIISDVVQSLRAHDAVALLVPTPDTIVQVDPVTGLPGEPLPRAELRRHQTPQGFGLGVLEEAHRAAADDREFAATDDVTLVQRHVPQARVGVVEGEARNLKITDATDLAVARALVAED